MHCQHASKIWFCSKLGIKFDNSHTNFPEWLTYAINSLNNEDLIYMAAVIYGIWYARNQKIFEYKDIEDYITLDKANTSIQEYQRATNTNNNTQHDVNRARSRNHQHRSSTNSPKRWYRPNFGIIKVNSDANLAVEGRWGLGATFRDYEGELIAAATWSVPGAESPTLAEAYAMYLAMTMAVDCCFQEVEFECDNIEVVSLVESVDCNPKSYLDNIEVV
jgi:hypothetical protein